jgi:nitroreductase
MLTTIFNHRSIRKYAHKEIDPDTLERILLAGTRASTTGNMQVYSIIVSTRPELKEKLWQLHFKQEMVRQAPVILTFCADFNRFTNWCLHRKAVPGYDNFLSFFTAAIDALLAAQNVALAAESLDLGICYLGTTTYMAEKIIEVLQLPKLVVPVTTLVMGYPDEAPELTDRLPLKAIIHQETYQQYTAQQIDELYREKESLETTEELLKINNKQTLAQIFTDNRYTKKDNLTFSQSLLRVLEAQGFMKNADR